MNGIRRIYMEWGYLGFKKNVVFFFLYVDYGFDFLDLFVLVGKFVEIRNNKVVLEGSRGFDRAEIEGYMCFEDRGRDYLG